MADYRRLAADKLLASIAELYSPRWQPQPHQTAPPGDWYGWLLLAGRGAGKTDACAYYMAQHVKGPACLPGRTPHWMAIIGPTQGDAATSAVTGPSGILAHSPDAKMVTTAGGTVVRWPNGSEAKLFGAHSEEEVERLRSGGNRCLSWLEELAAWRHLDTAFSHMRFGLRVGNRPHWIASTTPKPRQLIKDLAAGSLANVITTRASYLDNAHLPQHIKEALEETYGTTQLGRQELYGELIDQDENALWTQETIERTRWLDELPKLRRITVGVDPSGGRDEQGIVVGGLARLPEGGALRSHGFVLADRTVRLKPDGWGRAAVRAAIDFDADDIVVERNYGGDMAVATIRAAADSLGVSIPIRVVTATRGKAIRAQPVAALSSLDRWHHAGRFEQLESQMTTWTEDTDWSPDRLDAAVWTGWHNKVVRLPASRAAGSGKSGLSAMAAQKIG